MSTPRALALGLLLAQLLVSRVAAAPPAPDPAPARPPPAGLVRLDEAAPAVLVEPRYATAQNVTGAALPGYGAPAAWCRPELARALQAAAEALAAEGLGLRVYDAYRPARASAALVGWAQASGRADLLRDGYIASRSGHAHGHTVDLTLVDLGTGEPLDMGTPWDDFTPASHRGGVAGPAAAHRERLRAAMVAQGLVPYDKEWWHFRLPLSGTTPLDVPYGADEPLSPP
jgi:D-alanyl-D-alanine dipeptidase